jgi:hypothetical protein
LVVRVAAALAGALFFRFFLVAETVVFEGVVVAQTRPLNIAKVRIMGEIVTRMFIG